MNRNKGNQSFTQGKGGNPLLLGVLMGVVAGVSMAAAVAWYVMKSPKSYLQANQMAVNPPPDSAKSASAKSAPHSQPTTAASGVGSGKPRFEFYKVLTDKQETPPDAPAKQTDKPKAPDTKLATIYEPQILQAGSFSNQGDAEKLKAKLALLGMEAGIQSADIPDKGVWYRVRLGPYKNADEMNIARGFLKQNGVDSTPMRAQ